MSEPLLKRLMMLDRRVIYLLILLSVIVPLIANLRLPTTVTPEVQRIFDKIESLAGAGKAVLVSIDYEPSTQPELQPMTKAVLRHCFARKVPVLIIANALTGLGLALEAITTTSTEYHAENRKDWVFLGFQTPPIVVILGMGDDIKRVYPTDYYKVATSDIPLLKTIKNYDDIGLLVTIAGNSLPISWVTYAGTRYNVPIATGATAVSASDFYPYLQTGQFVGMMGGIKGAAEYEELVDRLEASLGSYQSRMAAFSQAERHQLETDRFTARRGMNPQSISHMLIILFIILGNIYYFAYDRKVRKS